MQKDATLRPEDRQFVTMSDLHHEYACARRREAAHMAELADMEVRRLYLEERIALEATTIAALEPRVRPYIKESDARAR